MFAYDDEDLRAIVHNGLSLGEVAKPSAKTVQWHLRTIGHIALMMRKFERASSTSYKRSLQYVFDKKEAIAQLRCEKSDQNLHVTKRLLNQVYFIRKFNIDWNEFSDIDADFLQSAKDTLMSSNEETGCDDLSTTAYLVSLAIKYLYRNSRQTGYPTNVWRHRELLDLIARSRNTSVKTELVWTLGFMVSNSQGSSSSQDKDIMDNKLSSDINSIILSNNEIGDEPKAFLLDQINATKCK